MSDTDYCGIVLIGGGSSWAWGSTPLEAATMAAKRAKRDWKAFFEFKRQHEFTVNVLDMREHKGWYCDYRGFFDPDSKEQIEVLSIEKIMA